jgi:hypothetical protein
MGWKQVVNAKTRAAFGLTLYRMERIRGNQQYGITLAVHPAELAQGRGRVARKLHQARHQLRRMGEITAARLAHYPTDDEDEHATFPGENQHYRGEPHGQD